MTAVIYARYSSDNQREESIEGQIRECTAYAEKNGITIVKHYIDRAISAKTDNRPQFQQMIKDSERGIFDVIIVWKLDRFARNRYDSARYKTQLKRNGVKLVSATEVISAGPEGIILESVLEGYAEYYSADLSEKVVRGMTENALKGIYNGGTIPFGYMIDETRHYQPDPLLAPYVEQTFQKYADGATMTDLRDWLKAHNIKNSMGGEMSYNTIQRMLSNRRYIGELRLRDVVQPNAIPALVSGELVGARPLHLAGARPFGHSKAPLGLLLLRKRESFMQTELSSILCVRLRPSAGWLQGSPCRRFLLPPAFRFAGAGVLPGSGLGNRSLLRSSRSAPAGACPACGHRYPSGQMPLHGPCCPAPT